MSSRPPHTGHPAARAFAARSSSILGSSNNTLESTTASWHRWGLLPIYRLKGEEPLAGLNGQVLRGASAIPLAVRAHAASDCPRRLRPCSRAVARWLPRCPICHHEHRDRAPHLADVHAASG